MKGARSLKWLKSHQRENYAPTDREERYHQQGGMDHAIDEDVFAERKSTSLTLSCLVKEINR